MAAEAQLTEDGMCWGNVMLWECEVGKLWECEM